MQAALPWEQVCEFSAGGVSDEVGLSEEPGVVLNAYA